ncbi:MAG: amidohydrolase family protein [Pseudomonadota bacterium]
MTIDRRRFLSAGALFTAGAGMGCTIDPQLAKDTADLCAAHTANRPLRIDMHIHLLNNKDVDGASMFAREFETATGSARLARTLVRGSARVVLGAFDLATHTAAAETAFLEDLVERKGPSIFDFCLEASERQTALQHDEEGLDESNDVGDGRLWGISSHRTRNAALLMAKYPEIDVFMPAIVDLFDRRSSEFGIATADDVRLRTTPLKEKIAFHRALNLATRGRFLPMVGFSPGRQYLEDPNFTLAPGTPLALVRDAILNQGFVGVKLHPSVGFSPIRNPALACDTRSIFRLSPLPQAEAQAYDRAMKMLFEFCEEHGVPLLTHASDSLSHNIKCMHQGDDPALWTSSTLHWVEVSRDHPDLRIVLAHFASRFHDQLRALGRGDKRPYGSGTLPVEYEEGQHPAETGEPFGRLKPSTWLEIALRDMRERPDSGLYLDLSFMPHLVLSQAIGIDGAEPKFGLINGALTSPATEYGGSYARSFTQFLQAPENAMLRERVLYGTDWPMPGIAGISNYGLYRRAIERILPLQGEYAGNIMGDNAARVFGLRPHDATCKRLIDFYERNRVDPGSVGWLSRVS